MATLQESITVANARLDAVETAVGVSPLLRIYTGALPANAAAARTGTKLVEMTLPSDWMANASGGSKAKSGTWSASGLAPGTAGYWSLHDSSGTTCHMQGDVTATGGGGSMTLDNTSIAISQAVAVNTFTLTDGNA